MRLRLTETTTPEPLVKVEVSRHVKWVFQKPVHDFRLAFWALSSLFRPRSKGFVRFERL